jgi:hypothetical protein
MNNKTHVYFLIFCFVFPLSALATNNPPTSNMQTSPISDNAWWSDQDAGWFGGIGGSVIGILGGAIGALTGFGKARRLAYFFLGLMFLLGLGCLILLPIALLRSQPYAVWYPLLMLGLGPTVLPVALFFVIRKRFREIELQKITALDA